jgi:hypothetical protein
MAKAVFSQGKKKFWVSYRMFRGMSEGVFGTNKKNNYIARLENSETNLLSLIKPSLAYVSYFSI